MSTMLNITLIIFAYLIGSLSSGTISCKLMGLPDPRTMGSQNPGATNVLRTGSKKAAIFTLLGDSIKGIIPVLLARLLNLDAYIIGMVALAAFLGHLFPVFFRFQGGKGVATAFGAMLALSLTLGIAVLITWLVIAALFRYSSLAALISALLAPAYAIWLTNPTYAIALSLMGLLLIVRHYPNLRRLIAGKESKINFRKPS